MTDKVPIRRLATGVPGLDAVLGGGVPEFSFNLIAGTPGAGKTTLVQQIMFASARPERTALFFTVLGEPPLKMLRYQQQFEFFDLANVNESVRFVNLGQEARDGGLDEVLKRIVQEVETASPAIVIVDSFRSLIPAAQQQNGRLDLQQFVQDLGMRLTGWQATTFLVGEFQPAETEHHPIFTVADGLVWLYQSIDCNSMVRKMQVMKMRGQAPIPGLHTFRITERGIQVGARFAALAQRRGKTPGQLALVWCKDQPAITAPIFGPRTMAHLQDALPALEMSLSDEERAACDDLVPPGGTVANFHNTAAWMKTPLRSA